MIVVTGANGRLGGAAAHLRYLQRDGVTREGEQGRFYSTFSDDVDGKTFLERSTGDRHQFRFIVSPEDGAAFDSLQSFTRELVAKMEQDLGTKLDWVWKGDNPHNVRFGKHKSKKAAVTITRSLARVSVNACRNWPSRSRRDGFAHSCR